MGIHYAGLTDNKPSSRVTQPLQSLSRFDMLYHLNSTLCMKRMEVVDFSSGSKFGWITL